MLTIYNTLIEFYYTTQELYLQINSHGQCVMQCNVKCQIIHAPKRRLYREDVSWELG